MSDEPQTTETQTQIERGGKYLTFMLGDEEYGLEILTVREIIGAMDVTSVPRTAEFIKGVINLRGMVIPVMDLRLKFGMDEAERTEQTCIIVVSVDDLDMGIVVDRVQEVLDIPSKSIEDAPEFGNEVTTEYILGMGKCEDRVTILLDIGKVVTREDLASMESAAGVG